METSTPEYQECTTIRFEWVVRNLKGLFESSQCDTKSKVTKSAKFDGGRWQILFYPNSGSANADGETFVSLYLSCEPTAEEKADAIDGKWAREGVFKFAFELRNLYKTQLFNFKEASDHSFSSKTQNWGWAQFARRDLVYYSSTSVRQHDAFLIVCTITSSPTPPRKPPLILQRPVPKSLLDSVGSLLDDPVYSDVEFVLPRRGRSRCEPRRIYAARKLLQREEYFEAMFHSGFAETSTEQTCTSQRGSSALDTDIGDESMEASLMRPFEDSDDEDESEDWSVGNEQRCETEGAADQRNRSETAGDSASKQSQKPEHMEISDGESWQTVVEHTERTERAPMELDEEYPRNVQAKLSHPSSPCSRDADLHPSIQPTAIVPEESSDPKGTASTPGHPKIRVTVRDVAYTTFKAVLYWIYTDVIVFAPLSSSFLVSSSAPGNIGSATISTPALTESQAGDVIKVSHQPMDSSSVTPSSSAPRTRREWIATWEKVNYMERPLPCSAKAVYRLADRFDLPELKERAFRHIVKSLTVENVAYEVFSNFSAAFEAVRKVEVRFFLDHWKEIRASDAMRSVWQQIRLGRHPGFEEVWPTIALNLEFKADSDESTSLSETI